MSRVRGHSVQPHRSLDSERPATSLAKRVEVKPEVSLVGRRL